MYGRARPVVNEFATGELLYRRHRREDFQNGYILPSALSFPKEGSDSGPSVNRSLFSRPEHTLWDNRKKLVGLGVYEFPVSRIPETLRCPNTQREFTFFAKHVPLWNNYAHTELWCDSLPKKNSGFVEPTKEVKKQFRAAIQKYAQPVIPAEI